jgi:hypothetical protein
MKDRLCAGLACALSFAAAAHAESQRFVDAAPVGDALLEVKVADALFRHDGKWLTLGSRVDDDSRETPYLVLRTAGGERVAAMSLSPDSGLSWTARSVAPVGESSDVLVLGIEYDHRDFGALSTLFLARLDANLGVVWSRHLDAPELWFEQAVLRELAPGEPAIVGIVQNNDGGVLDAGDAFFARIDPANGDLVAPGALGTPDARERIADAASIDTTSRALLVEVQRATDSGQESSDGIVTLDANGAVASTRLLGHPLVVGVRAQAQRLLRDGDEWIVAGRRVSLGPNFYYLQRLANDFMPAATRTLLPFFNAMDVAVRDGSVLLYGEANGEAQDRGSVLMRLDHDFAIELQRRYGTENQTFPTGAFAFGDGGIFLALGALREEDGFVYESAARVSNDAGAGLFCDEEDYDGFATTTDAPTQPAAWTPTLAALDVQTSAVAVTAATLALGGVAACTSEDELMFRHGFDA